MASIRYNKDKINDVFKYVDIKRFGPFATVYEGNQYFDTWNFSISEIFHFIDRDIFLLTKSEQLPSMEYQARSKGDGPTNKISLTILDIQEDILNHNFILSKAREFSAEGLSDNFVKKYYRDIFNELGHYILMKLNQELWKYNYESITTCDDEVIYYKKRFHHSVHFSTGLINREFKRVTCKCPELKMKQCFQVTL